MWGDYHIVMLHNTVGGYGQEKCELTHINVANKDEVYDKQQGVASTKVVLKYCVTYYNAQRYGIRI